MENLNPQQQTNRDEIARLAYQIWEQRGRPHGCDVECWLEAERQILSNSKPSQDSLAASVRAPEADATQSEPSRTADKPASGISPRTRKQAARSEGAVKRPTPARQYRPLSGPNGIREQRRGDGTV